MPLTPLAGRRVAITGATGGVGRALTAALAAAGARLAVTGRSADRLAGLGRITGVEFAATADICDEAAVSAFLSGAAAQLGGLDAVVTLAGRSIPGRIVETELTTLRAIMDSTVTGTFLACKHATDHLVPGGLIINVGSMAAHRANATAPLYCTAKAAVTMFSEALALQLAERDIRVTTISPGGADTEFWGDRPIDRNSLLAADDVVEAILFTLRLPAHVAVRELAFESTGRARSVA